MYNPPLPPQSPKDSNTQEELVNLLQMKKTFAFYHASRFASIVNWLFEQRNNQPLSDQLYLTTFGLYRHKIHVTQSNRIDEPIDVVYALHYFARLEDKLKAELKSEFDYLKLIHLSILLSCKMLDDNATWLTDFDPFLDDLNIHLCKEEQAKFEIKCLNLLDFDLNIRATREELIQTFEDLLGVSKMAIDISDPDDAPPPSPVTFQHRAKNAAKRLCDLAHPIENSSQPQSQSKLSK